jgi:phosphoglucomutase
MFAELAAYAMSEGKTITDLLDDLYREYGVHLERNESLVKEGAEGAAAIRWLTASYSENPPAELDGCAVTVRDFSTEEIRDEEGDLVPKSGMIVGELSDGRRFAVRPSGTEPKIKYYLFGVDEAGATDLVASKAKVRAGLTRLWDALRRDAEERMAG